MNYNDFVAIPPYNKSKHIEYVNIAVLYEGITTAYKLWNLYAIADSNGLTLEDYIKKNNIFSEK